MSAPRWARALLRLCVPRHRREDVLGDLEEMHARRRTRIGGWRAWWVTWADAAVVGATFLVTRLSGAVTHPRWPSGADVKLALRMARKEPLLNIAAVLALATGIGLAGAAFSMAETTFFPRIPLPAGDRFVRVEATQVKDGTQAAVGGERLDLFRRSSGAFAYLGAATDGSVNLLDGEGAVEEVRGVAATPDVFRVLPYRPVLGRTLVPEDGAGGATPVALLSERLWRRRYGADPGILGREIDMSGVARQVVGVMPDGADFPNRPDVWTPLTEEDLHGARDGVRNLVVFGVLNAGVDRRNAEARLASLSDAFEGDHAGSQRVRVQVRPFAEIPQKGVVQLFIGALFTAVVAVLLVIAANVGNLVAARTAARRGELAVRRALGAARHQLVLQLFGEVLLLGGIAAVLGGWGLHELMARVTVWLGSDLPFWVDFMPGPITWTFLGVVTVVACAVAGGVPALRATRKAPAEALGAAGRGGAGGVFGRSAPVTTVLQVAVSVALLGAAILAMRGMSRYAGRLESVPEEHILTAGMSLGGPGGTDSAAAAFQRIESAVTALPGVEHAGFATEVPRVEAPTVPVAVDPLPGEPPEEARRAPVVEARPGFLAALGASPVLGRFLQREDLLPGAPEVAVVNESFVRKFLHGRYPLGRRVRFVSRARAGGDDTRRPEWREIVGVVPDLGLSVGDPELEAGVYVPLREPSWVYLAVSVSGSPATLVDPLRRALARVDPKLLVSRVQTLDHVASENATALALFGGLLGALGGMALLLSVVSTYALVSFTVSRRLREVGIRVALGASRGAVLRSVAGRAALQVALGAALGAPLGVLLVQTRRLFVFRVPTGEWWILPSVTLAMLIAGVLASWYPAQRALGVEASEALKAE